MDSGKAPRSFPTSTVSWASSTHLGPHTLFSVPSSVYRRGRCRQREASGFLLVQVSCISWGDSPTPVQVGWSEDSPQYTSSLSTDVSISLLKEVFRLTLFSAVGATPGEERKTGRRVFVSPPSTFSHTPRDWELLLVYVKEELSKFKSKQSIKNLETVQQFCKGWYLILSCISLMTNFSWKILGII